MISPSWLVLSLTLALACGLPHVTGNKSERFVFATLIRRVEDVLPARVLFKSFAVHHSKHIERVAFAMPGALTARTEQQLTEDSVQIRYLPSEFLPVSPQHLHGASKRLLLSFSLLFKAVEFSQIVYLSPESLVQGDMSSLSSCPLFCAAFFRPCSFSCDLMVIKPSIPTFQRIISMWPKDDCVGRNIPDGLGEEACGLNEVLGRQLLNSSLLGFERNDEVTGKTDGASPIPLSLLRRIPIGYHVPHLPYYARLRFEVPELPCGPISAIDFSTPQFTKPWQWWTHGLLDLSWVWTSYRSKLADGNAPGDLTRNQVWLIVVVCHVACVTALGVVKFLSMRRSRLWSGGTALPRLWVRYCSFRQRAFSRLTTRRQHNAKESGSLTRDTTPIEEPVLLVYAVGFGLLGWCTTGFLALQWTSRTLMPVDGVTLAATYQIALYSVWMILQGFNVCAKNAIVSDLELQSPPTTYEVVLKTVAWSYFSTISSIFVVLVVNMYSFSSIYTKVGAFGLLAAGHVFVVLVVIVRVSVLWLAWGAHRLTSP